EAPAAVGVEEDVGVLVLGAQHLERAQDGGQLGDVVGALADELAVLDGLFAALDEHADAGGAGVAAARAVGVDDDRRVCRRATGLLAGDLNRRRGGGGPREGVVGDDLGVVRDL